MIFKLAVTGDNIINRRVSTWADPRFKEMVELIRGTDAAYTNLETLINDFHGHPSAISGGGCLGADKFIADEVKHMGFDIVSRANNHALDYGIEGMRKTSEILKEKEIVYAGVGENLGEARSPAYLGTPKGRVALVSAASSFPSWYRGVHARRDLQGRPGLNPLRFKTTHYVREEDIETLRKIRESLNMNPSGPVSMWIQPKPDEFFFLRNVFKTGGEPRVETQVNGKDLEENLEAVSEACSNADYILFSLHVHEMQVFPNSEPWREKIVKEPIPSFIVDFAHKVIDAGAHVFIGTGAHYLRPLEIYKGRPIFYSLSDFCFHIRTIRKIPSVDFERFDLDPFYAKPADLADKAEELKRWTDKPHWETVLPIMTFEGDELKSLELYPVSLGHGEKRTSLGTPRLADETLGKEIIDYYAEMSVRFGTEIVSIDGRGVVKL